MQPETTIGILCSKWNSVCFVLLADRTGSQKDNADTCFGVAAVHQYWAFEEGLAALSLQGLEVSIEIVPLLLFRFCQPVIQPKTVLTQLFGRLQKLVLFFYRRDPISTGVSFLLLGETLPILLFEI